MTLQVSSLRRAISIAALLLSVSSTVAQAIDLWGRAGTFGGLTMATSVPSGDGLTVHANGYGVDVGQATWYGAVTSDGTFFVATLTQSGNPFVPSACTMEIVCFNPENATCRDPDIGVPTNLAIFRIPAVDGTEFAPDAACQTSALGTDVADLAVWTSGGEEIVSFVSTHSFGPTVGWPIWGEVRNIGGLWQIDDDARIWPRDIRAATASPLDDQACPLSQKGCCNDAQCGGGTCANAAACAFSVLGSCEKSCTQDSDCSALGPLDYCEAGLCKRATCNGTEEMDLLPASNRMAVAQYFGGVLVTDGRDEVLAMYTPPAVPQPCGSGNVRISPRQVVADPTSTYGDERFMIVYDAFGDPRANPLQEFRYDDATRTLEPVTAAFIPNIAWMPIPNCSGPRQGGSAQYDEFGNLWVGATQQLQTHRLIFLKDPFTGHHTAAERCSYLDSSGQPRPWGVSCRADVGLGYWNGQMPAAGFSMPWANPAVYDHDTMTMFGVSNLGHIAPMSISENHDQLAFATLPPVDLGMNLLGSLPGQTTTLSGAGPEVPIDRTRRKLWIPIRGGIDGTFGEDVASDGRTLNVRVKGTSTLSFPAGDQKFRLRVHPGDGNEVDAGVCGEIRTRTCRVSSSTMSCRS